MATTTGFQNVTAANVYKVMNDDDVQIIDVREAYEWATGHIASATLISLQTIPANLDSIDKFKKLYIVCASGGRSVSASKYLSAQGYEVYNMVGGMMGWGYDVVK